MSVSYRYCHCYQTERSAPHYQYLESQGKYDKIYLISSLLLFMIPAIQLISKNLKYFFFSKFYTYFKHGIIYAVQWQNKKEGLYGEVSSYLCCWYRQDNIYCQNFIYGIFEMQELNPRILQRRAYISNWIEKNGQKKYRMQKCRSPPLIQTVIYI